ncbi:MAG: aldehyde dehydrogenase [Actinomycetota bacterium]|nr:aldehyde dehydrogenase [Actinomycetota bacterium]
MSLLTKEQYEKIASSVKFSTKALINGKLVDSISRKTYITANPATGQNITKIAACDVNDVNIAVEAARKSFEDGRWSKMAPSKRKEILLNFAEIIRKNHDELAVLEVLDSGRPIADIATMDVEETAASIAWHAEAADKLEDSITSTGPDNLSLVVREPVGVVGAILPWNFPLLMAAWKLGPILASGNSTIVKPAKLTSLTMLKLAELSLEAGIPEGVLNVVTGSGAIIGEAIGMHQDIDVLTFTGSTEVGRKLLEYSGQSNLKRVLMELGGKNPCVVMPDVADMDYAAEQVVAAVFWNMGENCTSNSRLIIHKDIKDKFLAKVIEKSKEWNVGNPLDPQFKLGSMIEKSHMETVLGYIKKGEAEGAKLVYGGHQTLTETGGYYIEPTIFDDVTPDMVIAREEIFGPVLAVLTCEDEADAISMANDTVYGLHASIFSDNTNQVYRLSRGIRAGTVSVNCFSEGDITTPFGGFKQSGFFSRDKSLWANRQYTELKTIWMAIR